MNTQNSFVAFGEQKEKKWDREKMKRQQLFLKKSEDFCESELYFLEILF